MALLTLLPLEVSFLFLCFVSFLLYSLYFVFIYCCSSVVWLRSNNNSSNKIVSDIGSVFGVGFPPNRGGPFRWIDSVGATKFVDVMKKYASSLGEHFTPAPLLVDMAKTNKKFHSS
jgi:hypothetical protein